MRSYGEEKLSHSKMSNLNIQQAGSLLTRDYLTYSWLVVSDVFKP